MWKVLIDVQFILLAPILSQNATRLKTQTQYAVWIIVPNTTTIPYMGLQVPFLQVIVCKALVPPKILEKFWFPPFFPHPKPEKLVFALLYPKFKNTFFVSNLKNYVSDLYRYHCKNTVY